ncbi:MAG TPA: DUF397 domain-containing protein [Streptosporangiaceae bacterium]|jgi:hypothetical protein
MREENRVIWRKSSFSAGDGNCVEVAVTRRGVGVRDTKNRPAGHLTVTRTAWLSFTRAITGAVPR